MEDRLTRVIKDLSTHSRQHHRQHHIKRRWLLSADFSYVWWGQVVSQVGDGVSKLALLWFVYSVTGSPLKTSIIGILQTAPAIVLAPIIGVAVDRLPKKALLIVSDLVRAVVIGLIPCWMSVDSFNVSSLYVLACSGHGSIWSGIDCVRSLLGRAISVHVRERPASNHHESGHHFGSGLERLRDRGTQLTGSAVPECSHVRYFRSLLHSDPVRASRAQPGVALSHHVCLA
jgi:hypothetical protein